VLNETIMLYSQEAHIDNVVQGIQRRIQAHRTADKLEKDAVEAIDIVHHGLIFTRHERGLELWRAALWEQRLDPEAERSLRAMLVYLLEAVSRGDLHEVSKICDCLHEIMPPQEAIHEMTSAAGSV
jgi:hypothetical protein